MPGRAIKYFDDVLRLDPKNQSALQEEGLAMMDKGAIESARQTLAQLKTMCAKNCAITEPLAAAIAAGPPKYMTAEASAPARPIARQGLSGGASVSSLDPLKTPFAQSLSKGFPFSSQKRKKGNGLRQGSARTGLFRLA